MSETDTPKANPPTVDDSKAGYKHPPVKNRFPKGKSGNPFGRRKGQRNLSNVLTDVLRQTVTVKQGDKSERLSKGEALIKVILNKANNGDRRAIDAVSYFAEKIGRVDAINSETSARGGVMLVPGVASSSEEWKKNVAEGLKQRDARDQQRKAEATMLEAKERGYRAQMRLHKGTSLADEAAARLAELKHSDEYLTNFYVRRNLALNQGEKETAVKKVPVVAKLPWDPDEYVRLPFHKRDEYARTHVDKEVLEAQLEKAPPPCYRRVGNPNIWSSVPWSELPPDDPRLRGEMPEGGCS
jgi:Family of unknown function (DUF5681)